MKVNSLFNYQGYKNKSDEYFEGWYLKVVDSTKDIAFAFIFGISKEPNDRHCFIQIINNHKQYSKYIRYDYSDFRFEDGVIQIKNNKLTPTTCVIKDEEHDLEIRLKWKNHVVLKKDLFNRSIMSFFKYLPLECYHEVVFLKAEFSGSITIEDFHEDCTGIAYMEKDLGKNFPKEHIWIQTNHFSKQNSTFLLGYAKVPLGTHTINGFFCVIDMFHEQKRFGTYNGARAAVTRVDDQHLNIVITHRKTKVKIKVEGKDFYDLKAPVKGKMDIDLVESINSHLEISMIEDGDMIFKDQANYVAFENTWKFKHNKKSE